MPENSSRFPGKPHKEATRTENSDPATEEEVYAFYIRVQNYAKTARKFGMPLSTTFDMVKRVGGDRLGSDRIAMRADIARKAWGKVNRLITLVREDNLGTEKSSQGFEAARSADALARIAGALDPRDQVDERTATVIYVNTAVPPPAEVAEQRVIAAQDSTLPKAGT